MIKYEQEEIFLNAFGRIIMMDIKIYEIQTEKLKKEESPLRIGMLTDLHNRLWGEGQRQLLNAIDSLCADLILCVGDMLIGSEQAEMSHTIELFRGLSKMNIPVFCSNGNHESRMRLQLGIYGKQYQQYAGQIRGFGIHILENEVRSIMFGSSKLKIYGYEMPLKYYRKLCLLPYDTQDLHQKFGGLRDDAYHILLAHNPVYFETYAKWGADLTLSGHLHGGIIRIPGVGGLITPQAKLFPKYDRGLFEEGGKYMVVSAGLGEHTIPIRIFNPPQLVLVIVKGTG